MRSNPRKAFWVKYEESKKWHPFFALFPTRAYVDEKEGIEQWVWLEWLERRRHQGRFNAWFVYRIPK